jgi:hypothetical protein
MPESGGTDKDRSEVKHSDHLITLVGSSGQASQTWLRFLVTIEGAMAAAYFYLAMTATLPRAALFLSILVCVVGFVLTEALVRIIERHHRWHAWFVKKYVAIPGNLQKVYPGEIQEFPARIDDVAPGYIAGIVRKVGWVLDAGWIVAAVVAIVLLVTK